MSKFYSFGACLAIAIALPLRLAAAGPAPEIGPSPAPSAGAEPAFRILAVEPYEEPDRDPDTGVASLVRGVPDRGLQLRFSLPTNAGDVSEAVVVDPPVRLHWRAAAPADEKTLRVPGSFSWGTTYQVVLTRTIRDKSGKHRLDPSRFTLAYPARPARLEFLRVEEVLELEGRQLVHLSRRGLNRMTIEVAEIPAVALFDEAWPPAGGSMETWRAGWELKTASILDALGSGSPFDGVFAPPHRVESEVFFEPGSTDRRDRSSVPLAWREGAQRGGAFAVRAMSAPGEAAADSGWKRLQITDLGIAHKRGPSRLAIWVTRLSSARPVAGARIMLQTGPAGLAAVGSTDAEGLLVIEDGSSHPQIDAAAWGFPVATASLRLDAVIRILALAGDDRVFAATDGASLPIPPMYRPSKARGPDQVRAHLFTERGLYRPGETVHAKVTARRFEDGEVRVPVGEGGAAAAVKLRLLDARDEVVREWTRDLSGFGTVALSLSLRGNAPLGQWTLEVRDPGGKVEWGRTTFRVEDFLPPRHRVEVSFRDVASGEVAGEAGSAPAPAPGPAVAETDRPSVEAVVRSSYYAGGFVKHGKVRWRVHLIGTRHQSRELGGPLAGTDLPGEPELVESGESTLDEQGGLAIRMPLSDAVLEGRRALSVSASVVDFDGRIATGVATHARLPDYLVGISRHSRKIERGEDVLLEVVVLDRRTGRRVDRAPLTVELLEERWASVRKRAASGDVFWSWETLMARSMRSRVMLEEGRAKVPVSFGSGGKHQVAVGFEAPDGRVFRSTTSFEVQWGYDERGEAWEADRMRRVAMAPDRESYVPGETAVVRIQPPRRATTALVCLERDDLLEIRRVELQPEQTEIQVPLAERHVPNVFVGVLAVHPRGRMPTYASEVDADAPGFSYGYANLPVRRNHGGLAVKIVGGAGESVRASPGTRHTVTLEVVDREGRPVEAEVALGVVDESVLAMTSHPSPTLGSLFEVTLPLRVSTAETRSGLTLQTPFRVFTVRPLTGGDGGDGSSLRTREWFDPVACFRPDLVTDAKGRVEVSFLLPDTMTTYRVYALACDRGPNHGSTVASLQVRDPFRVEPGLPRFLTRGDRGRFLVAVFNDTGQPGPVHVTAVTTAPLSLEVGAPDFELPNGSRHDVAVTFEVAGTGSYPVTLEARMEGRGDRVLVPVELRSDHVMRTRVVHASFPKGAADLDIELPGGVDLESSDAVAGTRISLELAALDTFRLRGGLRYLLRYPHGCVEQTSSGLLPLAILDDLIDRNLVPGLGAGAAARFIRPGVDRVLSMQTSSGGFGYWPGYSKPHPFASAYATLALSEVRRAGGEVPDREFGKALSYLEVLARSPSAGDPMASALAHLVLAQNGRTDLDPLGALKARGRPSHQEALLLLLAAGHAGAEHHAREMLAQRLRAVELGVVRDAFDPLTFGNGLRPAAIELWALTELNPKHPRRAPLVDLIYREVGGAGHWGSTHDTGWALAALGRHLAGAGDVPAQATACRVRLPDGSERAVSVPPTGLVQDSLPAAAFTGGRRLAIGREGPGPVHARLEIVHPETGTGPAGTPALTRRYRRLAGEGPIRVGDLVEVEIEWRVPKDRFHYVALTDPAPAGLMPVNTQLASEEQSVRPPDDDYGRVDADGTWIATFTPSHLEMHKDRVVAYRDYGWRGRYRFSWVGRAVCAGVFRAPPAVFEPMYQPEDALYSAAATVEILPAGP